MKTLKKLTAFILTVILTLSMCVTGVSAASETEIAYIVAGSESLLGVNWVWDIVAVPENVMTQNTDGTYSLEIADVQPTDTDYQFKVVGYVDETTSNWYGDATGNNITFNVTETCDVTITFDTATDEIKVTGDNVTLVTDLEIDGIYAVGNGYEAWLNDVNWDPADKSNEMKEISDKVYSITYKNVEENDNYQLKFAANGSWNDNWGGVYEGSGVVSEAVYNGQENITVAVPYKHANVTITFDLTNFNYSTKSGATFKVDVVDVNAPTEPDPSAVESAYIVAGSEALLGVNWVWDIATAPENVMTQNADGTYSLTITDVQSAVTDYQLKVVGYIDSERCNWYGDETDNNITFNVTATCDVTVTFNAETKEIKVEGENVVFVTELEIESIYAVGNGYKEWLNNSDWEPDNELNKMTEISENVYSITYKNVEQGEDYQLKFAANGTWNDSWGGIFDDFGVVTDAVFNEQNIIIEVPYKLADVTLTLDLTSFNYTTKLGATFKIDVVDVTPVKSVTLKFAAPTSKSNRYNWTDAVFYYGSSATFANNTTVPMTATKDKYYTGEVGASRILCAGAWTIYEVRLTESQMAEVETAKFVGFATSDGVNRTSLYSSANVLKASVDSYDYYSSSINDLDALNGATFVIADTTSASSYTAYKGYWVTKATTVKFAAPVANTKRSTWDAVDLYFGSTGNFDDTTKLSMINTYETTKVSDVGDMTTLKAGRWYIFAVSLNPTQVAAVNASTKVGFAKLGDTNKTSFSKNVLFAKTDEYTGAYNTTKRTIEELEGQVFVVQAKATATSQVTFLGEWQSEAKYAEDKDDTVTIYFAAPKGVSSTADWSTGVELYYGKSTAYKDTNRIAMKKRNKAYVADMANSNLTTLASGYWDIYSVELTGEQIAEIDAANNVGFIKAGSYNRTSILITKSITRASRVEDVTEYASAKETIEAFDGYTFIINDMLDEKNERTSYIGSWIVF